MVKKLGKYEIVETLGEGAMGTVYKAYDEILDRYVAIKIMGEDIKWDQELKLRFYREARSAASLHHPNIVTIHDLGEEGKITYIVMELLAGDDLKEFIKSQKPLPLEQKLSIIAQVADGLNHAHLKGIIHRDIKPGNIHVSPSGNVKILDFGIARIPSSDLTRSGVRLGTPIYMSPEQIRGGDYDERSDIFSAGIVFYELMTCVHPFRDKNIAKTLDNILFQNDLTFSEQVPDAPSGLWPIIEKCLAKESDQRYSSISELGESCRNLMVDLDVESQGMLKELQNLLPRLQEKCEAPDVPHRLMQLLGQTEALLSQEEKPDHLALLNILRLIDEQSVESTTQPLPRPEVTQKAEDPHPPQAAESPERPRDTSRVESPSDSHPAPSPPDSDSKAGDASRGRDLLQTGHSLFEDGQLNEARDCFRQALGILGPQEEIIQALADVRRQIGELRNAQVSEKLKTAQDLMSARKYPEVIDTLNEILKIEPGRKDAVDLRRRATALMDELAAGQARKEQGESEKRLGFKFIAEGKYREGLLQLQQAATHLGDDPAVSLGIEEAEEALRSEELQKRANSALTDASGLLNSGAFDQARRLVEYALGIKPDDAEARALLDQIARAEQEELKDREIKALLSRAQEALNDQRFDEASLRVQETLGLEPENAAAKTLLSKIEEEQERARLREETDKLITLCEEALDQENFSDATALAKQVLVKDPEHTGASNLLDRIRSNAEAKLKDEKLGHLNQQGRQSLINNDIQEAEKIVHEMLQVEPDYDGARQLQKEIREFRESKRQEQIQSLISAGLRDLEREEFEEAIGHGRKALDLEPGNIEAQQLLRDTEKEQQKRLLGQIEDLHGEGQKALANNKFDEAAHCADRIFGLDDKNKLARVLVKQIKKSRRRDEKERKQSEAMLARHLTAGQKALRDANVKEAKNIAHQMLQIDPHCEDAKGILKQAESISETHIADISRGEPDAIEDISETRILEAPDSGLEPTVVLDDPKQGIKIPRAAIWIAIPAIIIVIAILYRVLTTPSHQDNPSELTSANISEQLESVQDMLSTNRFDQAIATCERILEVDPNNTVALAMLGDAQSRQKQSRLAALLLQAQNLKDSEQFEDCREVCEKILEIDPNSDGAFAILSEISETIKGREAQDAQIKQWLANASRHLANGRLDRAQTEIRKVSRVRPDEPQLSTLQRRLRNARREASNKIAAAESEAEAQKRIERIAEIQRQSGNLFNQGKYDEAQLALDQWLALEPDSSGANTLRSKISQARGSISHYEAMVAQKLYDEAVKAAALLEQTNPQDPRIAEFRKRAETLQAAARATFSIYRLGGPACHLTMDGRQIGMGADIETEEVGVGEHVLRMLDPTGKEFSITKHFYDGENISYVYHADTGLREFTEEDRQTIEDRRFLEEVRLYTVDYEHGAWIRIRKKRTPGTLRISGIQVEHRSTDASLSWEHSFDSLALSLSNDKIEIKSQDGKNTWKFVPKDSSQATAIQQIWQRLKELNQK